MDSDSSSEDEDRNAMLREAVYDNSKDLYRKENNTKHANHDTVALPSRRPDKERVTSNEENAHFYLELTKGAKDFLAKKLEDHLESELDSKEACFYKSHERESPENSEGIRLFSNSDQLVTSIDPVPEKHKPRRRKLSSSDSSSEDERLNEAAVSHDFIMEQSREVITSNITPADIVITNTKDDINLNVNGETGDSKKKKKKKKKKSKKDEIT